MPTMAERNETLSIIANQTRETVNQSNEGVVVRLGTITCPCGWKRGITKMYQCLYCGVWFCEICAETHFGKTRAEHRAEHPITE